LISGLAYIFWLDSPYWTKASSLFRLRI